MIFNSRGGGFLARAGAGSYLGRTSLGGSGSRRPVVSSPFATMFRRTLGPTRVRTINQDDFNNTMRRFGDTLENKVRNYVLAPVADGTNIGDAYYRGMIGIYNFVRSGGGANVYTEYTGGGGGDHGQAIERPSQDRYH